ncbi:hypothetical protein [Mesomycoplasma hyorhinis]|uniref:hypothetical protein n=1 Tax=Mesomycoplasma hyorhinis TaxID=2100 RepID=UPI001C051D13|nr:hypothetical protein [Mesomycoplasma hyorhinis]
MSGAHIAITIILPFVLFLIIIFVFSFEKHYSKLAIKSLKDFELDQYFYLKEANKQDLKAFFLIKALLYFLVIVAFFTVSIIMVVIFNASDSRLSNIQKDQTFWIISSISFIALIILISLHLFVSSKMFLKSRNLVLDLVKNNNANSLIEKLFNKYTDQINLQDFDFEMQGELFSKLKIILNKAKNKSIKLTSTSFTKESIFFKSFYLFSQYFYTFVDKNFKDYLIYYYQNKKIESKQFNLYILIWIYQNVYQKI